MHALLTIDFGSAFTKVAARTGWDTTSFLVHGLSLAEKEATFCIPSVVARVQGSKGARWAVGVDAANLLPGPDAKIFENWKADLFRAAPGGGRFTNDELAEVGTQFFRGLRYAIRKHPRHHELADLPLRLCIPRLADSDGSRELVLDVLRASGWKLCPERPLVSEPESNVLGVLSRGRNSTWRPSPRGADFTYTPDRSPDLPKMLEPSLSEAFRKGALQEKRGYYGVLVTDIGAFTTDFGYVHFDSSFWTDDWNKPDITAVSYHLGVRQLDDAVLACLSPEARDAKEHAAAADWDTCKRLLYHGKPAQMRKREAGLLTLGDGAEANAIGEAIRVFAERVWQARQEFAAKLAHSVHAEVFTGGGFMIPLVRKRLVRRVKEAGTTTVHDLLDENEARKALQSGASERDVERRRVDNRELVRGASAIGACSVFFEKQTAG